MAKLVSQNLRVKQFANSDRNKTPLKWKTATVGEETIIKEFREKYNTM